MPRALDVGLCPDTLPGWEGCGQGREELNPSLQSMKPCPELLWFCQSREQTRPPAAATWARGEGFVEVAEHSLGLPKASLYQLCQGGPPQTTVSPAWRRGCQQLHWGLGAALPPTHQHDDPDKIFPAGAQSHILQRDTWVPGCVCIDNKPAATDLRGSKLASGGKTPRW